MESFFERKKQLSDSVKKTAGKGKGKKVGIKVPEDEVDAEFMDVDVSDAAPTMRMQEIMRRFGRILNQVTCSLAWFLFLFIGFKWFSFLLFIRWFCDCLFYARFS